ncbi:MAG TPA: CUAEP/CCAEP-tail radical SAM protein [Vicinamibacterales bacterium]|nr:CUAEP/CCAEP-tail radical SAM protein [Vicinamibacterales bacterium]
MRALVISTYEMGRQPFGVASAAAWLRETGWDVTCVDVVTQKLADAAMAAADLVGFHLPMHTATRLASPVIRTVRARNPGARLCAFGLYAPLNEPWLRSLGVDAIFGGEFEADLAAWANSSFNTLRTSEADDLRPSRTADRLRTSRRTVPRIHFLVPDRSTLPPLSQYAALQMPDGSRRTVGYTEASRGCKHLCRHCPVVPIYDGQFRIVPPEIVLADVAAQVAAGAQHITFGDPDFFNGPTHAMRIVEALQAAHPGVTFDVTIKVEHLLRHRDLLPRLARAGCAFVTSAVESLDDRVLALLDKGHTRADFIEAVEVCRRAGVTLAPTFVAFHPWLTIEGYCDLVDTIAALDLVDHVAPIQLAIRLLVPEGSRLLTVDEMRRHLGDFDSSTLTYRWRHPDPAVDALHDAITRIVGTRLTADRRAVFAEISALAHVRAGTVAASPRPARARATVPYLNEPWYC